jgi:citrate lyase beta subunit
VAAKLAAEPVEDLRIDFEDGYGSHPDPEEDTAAVAAAAELASGLAAATLPPRIGLRIKPFTGPARARGIRTLDVFLTALLDASGGRLPGGFVVTFPKAMVPEQVTVLVEVLDALEQALSLPAGVLRVELQVETTQALLDQLGTVPLPQLVAAARGRCTALHFGTYDYTAACGLPPSEQHLAHPACDFARHLMQVATAGTGVLLADGSSNLLPVGPPDAVRGAWRVHYGLVRRSLAHGFYQGWDLHPAQLVSRYAAVFAFFREHLPQVTARLRAATGTGAEAAGGEAAAGPVAEEPATARMLAAWLARGLDCGAIDPDETGVARPLLAQLTAPPAGAPPAPPSPR